MSKSHRLEPIVFGRPSFDEAEVAAASEVIRSSWIGQGPKVEQFERELGSYVGATEVVAVSSCTAALHSSLVALGIGAGDEVITTPFTFIATINAVEHAGAVPVMVDIDPQSLNLDPASTLPFINSRTRAIMPVHFGGRPLDVDGFYELADLHDLWIVEDAAHAIGTVANGRHIGGSGHEKSLTCFSFYPNKNLATAEGGAITLTNSEVAGRLRSLRLHGLDNDAWARFQRSDYQPALATSAGYKYNMTDLQAVIASVQLSKLEGFLAAREYLATCYDELLSAVEGVNIFERPAPRMRSRHALHLYQVILPSHVDRDRVVDQLRRRGIGAAVHYIGVNRHPFYQARFAHLSYPVSDWASEHLISLPLHPEMTPSDVRRVVSELVTAVNQRPQASDLSELFNDGLE